MKCNLVAWVTKLFSKRKIVLNLNAVVTVVYLLPGRELKDGLSQAIEIAKVLGEEIDFNCGDIILEVNSNSTVERLYQQFQDKKVKPK